MERRIEADVEGWPTRPFEDGYDGLRQLASVDFSGVVRAGGTWLFFVNGKIVGVFEGTIEDVEDAQGTAHKAPHPSLPLLYAMQTEGGDTRAKYYTNDTPISQVDSTLSSGSFTGYVELSENVLSGDYYQLYHGGHSMSVAFVGNSGKMITGEDAFERADDEVGIYEVVDVDIEVTDVPQPDAPDDSEATDEPEATGAGATAADDATESTAAETDAGEDSSAEPDPDTSEASADAPEGTTADSDAGPDGAVEASTGSEPSSTPPGDGSADTQPDPGTSADAATQSATDSSTEAANDDGTAEAASPGSTATKSTTDATASTDASQSSSATDRRSSSDRSSSAEQSSGDEPATGSATATGTDARAADHSSSDRSAARTADTDDASSTQRGAGAPEASGSGRPVGQSTDASEDGERAASAAGQRGDDDAARSREDDPRQSEAAWREATTVPALDPDRTESVEASGHSQGPSQRRQSRTAQQARDASASTSRSPSRSSTGARDGSPDQAGSARSGSSTDRSASGSGRSAATDRTKGADNTLEQEVLEREDRIDRLQQRVENLEDERDEVTEERDRLQQRVDSLTEENESLRGEIRSLEQDIEELEAAAASAEPTSAEDADGDSAVGGPMTPRAALEGTDLFVRYDSKSAPTLEAAHDGSADATAVNENLRLDVHTQFEDEGVTVNGDPFDAFLRETMAYRFVEWLVRTLPYEVRETDSAAALRDLFDALPEIDRVEFHGEVARDAVEGEEGAPSETFDVVVRDKMGEALLVANMNDARDPATGRMIVDLQEGASRVKEHSMALAGAFFVTRSFFEPAALETASEATSGSLLSRDSRASYVKLSRKQGYHLCLVEARGDDLHLNVPEL